MIMIIPFTKTYTLWASRWMMHLTGCIQRALCVEFSYGAYTISVHSFGGSVDTRNCKTEE